MYGVIVEPRWDTRKKKR